MIIVGGSGPVAQRPSLAARLQLNLLRPTAVDWTNNEAVDACIVQIALFSRHASAQLLNNKVRGRSLRRWHAATQSFCISQCEERSQIRLSWTSIKIKGKFSLNKCKRQRYQSF